MKIVKEFFRRGMIACGIGPLVLVALYCILHWQTGLEHLTVGQVCTGILSLAALAFISGGMNAIYQLERLPLMAAIWIHGCVLYAGYLGTYLLNDWLEWGMIPILVFSGIFVVGYLVIWVIIYSIIKNSTKKVNAMLRKKQASG